jgi:L-lactate dehydrogenase complex protein LldG
MNGARAEILARVNATAHTGPERTAPSYRRTGNRSPAETVALFCERVADYRAEVRQVTTGQLTEAIAAACRAHGARRVVIPPGLPTDWRPDEPELVEDLELRARDLDSLDGVLTGCTVAVAETGTIVLGSGPDEGRRAISLVPDLHICVVREDQIVELVPEAIEVLGDLLARERRAITLISGPSATSDIELSRVEGVHGPRTLVVLVVTRRRR